MDLETSENIKTNEKFEIIDGLVFKKGPDKSRFYILDSMVNDVIIIYMQRCAKWVSKPI